MRNQHAGPCYRCGSWVAPGEGHFERHRGGWRVQHAGCAVKHRGEPDPMRGADRMRRLKWLATQTGRKAQRARAQLRKMETTNV